MRLARSSGARLQSAALEPSTSMGSAHQKIAATENPNRTTAEAGVMFSMVMRCQEVVTALDCMPVPPIRIFRVPATLALTYIEKDAGVQILLPIAVK